MLSSFPNPYPDEILYSTVARYHQRSGNILFRQTVEELFGDRSAHSAVVLPAGLGALPYLRMWVKIKMTLVQFDMS